MTEVEQAASFAIAEAKNRGHLEIGPDDLLMGCLRVLSRFGVVSLGTLTVDLEELGIDWLELPKGNATKVAYSQAVIALFDLAARIARTDALGAGLAPVRIEHMLAAFAGEETGLMAELKRKCGVSGAGWRAAVAQFSSTPAVKMSAGSPAVEQGGELRDYLTPEEAAEALGIHVQTLRGYVRSGKLPAHRLAGERAIRIRRSDLEAVLEPLVPQKE
jgi:excisionase family DNA binding protein